MTKCCRGRRRKVGLVRTGRTLHGHAEQQGLNAFGQGPGGNWYKSIPRFPACTNSKPKAKSICAACRVCRPSSYRHFPSGLNASSDGETTFSMIGLRPTGSLLAGTAGSYPKGRASVLVRGNRPDIGFTFVPLYQMTPRLKKRMGCGIARRIAPIIYRGRVVDRRFRERLAGDPE